MQNTFTTLFRKTSFDTMRKKDYLNGLINLAILGLYICLLGNKYDVFTVAQINFSVMISSD